LRRHAGSHPRHPRRAPTGLGRQDPHVPDGARAGIYQALVAAGTTFTWHEFNAQHAFMRDEGPRYDAEAARIALGLALALFQRTL